jgi:hypothetical protein
MSVAAAAGSQGLWFVSTGARPRRDRIAGASLTGGRRGREGPFGPVHTSRGAAGYL